VASFKQMCFKAIKYAQLSTEQKELLSHVEHVTGSQECLHPQWVLVYVKAGSIYFM